MFSRSLEAWKAGSVPTTPASITFAGDWVRIGLNAGCIEQAVLGGRAAARAITGVDMNSQYDNDRNWNDDSPVSPGLAALLSNLPDLTRLALAGVGRVEACCIVDYVPPALIDKMLPPGLTLNLRNARPPEMLPICLLFSELRQVRPGFVPFGGISYMEFAIIFHDVYNLDTNDDYNGPFIYMPRILLNSLPPVAVGVMGYGFNKRLARIGRVGDSFDIRNDEGEISARFEDASLLGQIGDFHELSIIERILNQPVISETSEGRWISSPPRLSRASGQLPGSQGTLLHQPRPLPEGNRFYWRSGSRKSRSQERAYRVSIARVPHGDELGSHPADASRRAR
jgi:hypothetical protein